MSNGKAVTLATDYFQAWTSGDVTKALEFVADNAVIEAPNGSFNGHSGYHDFMDGFVQMLDGADDLSVFGDDNTAVLWYSTHLKPVPTLVAGERIQFTDDKITRIDITFDTAPLAQAFGGEAPSHGDNSK